jgi:Cytotoxic
VALTKLEQEQLVPWGQNFVGVDRTNNFKRKLKIAIFDNDINEDHKDLIGKVKKSKAINNSNNFSYEWDHTHNDIEVYDSKGRHLGSKDPLTSEMYKGPVKGRKIKF